MTYETAFSMDTSSIKYGPGVTREVGWDMEEQGAKRVMVVTDPDLADKEPVAVTLEGFSPRQMIKRAMADPEGELLDSQDLWACLSCSR